MNSAELKNKISDLRPNYSDKFRSMIEAISNKQERIGKGNIAQFGPYFQTFMYACGICTIIQMETRAYKRLPHNDVT